MKLILATIVGIGIKTASSLTLSTVALDAKFMTYIAQ
jgi:hypothetical protein